MSIWLDGSALEQILFVLTTVLLAIRSLRNTPLLQTLTVAMSFWHANNTKQPSICVCFLVQTFVLTFDLQQSYLVKKEPILRLRLTKSHLTGERNALERQGGMEKPHSRPSIQRYIPFGLIRKSTVFPSIGSCARSLRHRRSERRALLDGPPTWSLLET
jgi:hypothetical protein